VQWLAEHLVTAYGPLGILVVASWAWTLLLWRRVNYLTELCLRLQEQRTTDQRRLVSEQFSRLNETAERLAKAYAIGSPSTLRQLALDSESDFSISLSELNETDPSDRKTLEMKRR